ncbi:helix-turn-helix domain-containing protein [Pedococcus soli]
MADRSNVRRTAQVAHLHGLPRPAGARALPQFRGTASPQPTAQQRRELIEFVARQYQGGRSLRELAELTDRTQSAVGRALDQAGVPIRGPGAQRVSDGPSVDK